MITPEVEREFGAAKANGWLPAFAKAGTDYQFRTALLLAIASRETNMRNIVGDGGHGYGLMQIDIRTDPDFATSGGWRNVPHSIERGAQILDQKRSAILHGQGASLSVGGYQFIGARMLENDVLLRVATAAYNCGLWAYYAFSRGEDLDRFTTGRNYSSDVWQRKAQFEELLGKAVA